jgi:hypothetical protein
VNGLRIVCEPTGKQVYGTLGRALFYRAQVSARMGVPYRVYQCPHCGYWHLTRHPYHRRGRAA